MKRRGFLKGLLAAPIAATAVKAIPDDGIGLTSISHPSRKTLLTPHEIEHGPQSAFGLAPIKQEGRPYAPDPSHSTMWSDYRAFMVKNDEQGR